MAGRPEHVVGYFEHDGENVGAAKRVGAGPVHPVEVAFGVHEEGVAALTDKQPARAGLHRPDRGIEAHRRSFDEHVTTGFARLGLGGGGVITRCGLPTVCGFGEREAERNVR